MLILKNNEERINGENICHHIEQKLNIELPEKGYLAGQSVASAFFEITNKNFNPVYNDLDIFHDFSIDMFEKKYIDPRREKRFQYKNNKKFVEEHVFFERKHDEYKEQTIRNEGIFSIHKSRRLDLFNFISITPISNKMNIKYLIESFDLNCTKIGVDLKTKELYLSNDFKDFIKFNKLLLTDFGLPYHNPIRYLKKLSDLEIENNFDEAVLEINNYAISIEKLISQKKEEPFNNNRFLARETPAFGRKYKELFEKHNKLHDYYYMCVDKNYHDTKNELFKLIPKKQEKILDDREFYNNISNEMKLYNKNVFKEIRLLKYLKDSLQTPL